MTMVAFVGELWREQILDAGREGVFLVFVGFLGSFLAIRTSTRLMRSPKVPWWPGSVTPGGLHIHHLVFGIALMLIAPTITFATGDESPWWELTALAFGIGAGLTFDEFALWLHLDDVYWSKEGRSSIDATLIAVGIMGLILLGAAPYDVSVEGVVGVIAAVAVFVLWGALVLVCLAKQRFFHGLAGVVVSPFAIYGAVRLGKPGSAWARRFYGARRPDKQAKAEQRFRPDRRTEQLKKAVRDAVGGTPTDEYEAKIGAGSPPRSD